MSATFDQKNLPGTAPKAAAPAKARSERLFVQVTEYLTPQNEAHFAVGKTLDGEDVKVRLTTVKERVADKPNSNEEAVKSLYATGENHRDNLLSKSAAGITLLSFDDARKLSVDENGVAEYRAHWPNTMSTNKEAFLVQGFAHIQLRDADPENGKAKADAYVEMTSKPRLLTTENVAQSLEEALSPLDKAGFQRQPFVMLRAIYDDKPVANFRIYPAREERSTFDQATGDDKIYTVAASAKETIDQLLKGNKPMEDGARAVVAALTGAERPNFYNEDQNIRNQTANLYEGIKQGAVHIEMTPAVKIEFGADTRKVYLKNKEQPQLRSYMNVDGRERAGFTETVVALQRHADGEAFAVFAASKEMYPKMEFLRDRAVSPVVLEEIHAIKAALEAPKPAQQIENEDSLDNAPAV